MNLSRPYRSALFRSLRCLLALAALGLAATAQARFSVVHDPLYQATTHTSTITASAVDQPYGVVAIEITVTTGEMTDCSELGMGTSVLPCRRGATTVVHRCSYLGWPRQATCSYSQVLTARRLVSYRAVLRPVFGTPVSSEEVSYAGGTPPAAPLARPVVWERMANAGRRIDVGLFPDADYGSDYHDFTRDLQTVLLGAFFNDGQSFAQTYTARRRSFNLWAGPAGADAEGCLRRVDGDAAQVAAVLDGQVIVHRNEFRDCASLSLGGAGSVWGKLTDAAWVFMHESAHFLFGQGDEYCCDGGYGYAGDCGNVFSSSAACRSASLAQGVDPGACVTIGNTGSWRNDSGGGYETMADRTFESQWLDNSRVCVERRLSRCARSTCY
ncbi:hypothetical protein OOT46_07630 [Aquabacterium sp. A7-Y]|uniref:hypothetical protein n=1 Tax=Aquabacterium sp. A7-Y TaxID=1349605 RepID=UPI00223DF72D|nr:hypothetical protein [Aquabacterium sp. A7-Y]MCW7537720.1 hypothetical protein [Aquabacterium sp. A7-Y]